MRRHRGFDLQLTLLRRARLASHVPHDWDGAFSHERDGIGVGAHALARYAAGGVGGVEEAT